MKPVPLFALSLPFLATVAVAQSPHPRLELTELLLDPIGANAGQQLVEVTVVHGQNVDTTGFQLVSWPAAAPFPAMLLPADQILRLHVGASGVDSISDLYFPTLPPLANSGTLAIYDSSQLANAASLVDFVGWGGGAGLIQQAVQAQRWPSTLASCTLPTQEGASLANRTFARWEETGPDAWYRDTTPTLGLPNDPGGTFNFGIGCTVPMFPPEINVRGFDAGPWLGENWRLDFYYLPQPAGALLLALAAANIGPVPLQPFGIPDCFADVGFDTVLLVPTGLGAGTITFAVPRRPELVGFELFAQAFVPDPLVQNPAHALVSNTIVAFVGSR